MKETEEDKYERKRIRGKLLGPEPCFLKILPMGTTGTVFITFLSRDVDDRRTFRKFMVREYSYGRLSATSPKYVKSFKECHLSGYDTM
jgi:hypothetical protein